MKLHNPDTLVSYVARTTKEHHYYVSIVERWETDSLGIAKAACITSREIHRTRSRAYRYATSMARYQFDSHCLAHGAVAYWASVE
jgi:hypothetical protein